jgi:hypothetical protein
MHPYQCGLGLLRAGFGAGEFSSHAGAWIFEVAIAPP